MGGYAVSIGYGNQKGNRMKTNKHITSIIANNIHQISYRSPKDVLTYIKFVTSNPSLSPFELASIKRQVLRLNNGLNS